MSGSGDPDDWPKDVRQIGVGDLRRLGIDSRDQLFWDGRPVEIRRPLVLTRPQKLITAIVTVFAVLGGFGGFVSGVNNASVFLCARHIQWLSCPAEPKAPPTSSPLRP